MLLWNFDEEFDCLLTLSKINLLEAKLKSYRLAALTEDISEQPSIDCVMWLIMASLMQMCNEKEQAEQGQI